MTGVQTFDIDLDGVKGIFRFFFIFLLWWDHETGHAVVWFYSFYFNRIIIIPRKTFWRKVLKNLFFLKNWKCFPAPNPGAAHIDQKRDFKYYE